MAETESLLPRVHDPELACALVRRSSATAKLRADALKTCRGIGQQPLSLKQEVAEAHLRTQRRAGEILVQLEMNPGGRPPSDHTITRTPPATLHELAITWHESHRWQRIASIPNSVLDEFLQDGRQGSRELTTASALC